MKELPKIDILGIFVTNATGDKILEYVVHILDRTQQKLFISTPNPEMVAASVKNPRLKILLNQAQISLADGVGLQWAARILKKPVPYRTTGADFMEQLCEAVSEKPITVGFLGGRPNIAKKTAECLQARYPRLRVAFAQSDYLASNSHKLAADIVFVALGFPKQEEWIVENLPNLPIRVAMSVGGSFDYIAGEVSRAPKFIRTMGLEWLYRLIRQPWRWKRQLALISFMQMVFTQKISQK